MAIELVEIPVRSEFENISKILPGIEDLVRYLNSNLKNFEYDVPKECSRGWIVTFSYRINENSTIRSNTCIIYKYTD